MSDDDDTSMLGNVQDLVIGAVVLMAAYCAWRFINSPVSKAVGNTVNGAANLVTWSTSSPYAFILTLILGLVTLVLGRVGFVYLSEADKTLRETKSLSKALGFKRTPKTTEGDKATTDNPRLASRVAR